MKILMIDHWSDKNVYTLELCDKLSQHVELELLTVDDSLVKGTQLYNYNKVLLGYGNKKSPKLYFSYLKSLLIHFKNATSKKFQAVHVQSFRNRLVEIPLYILFKPLIKKLVLTVHNILPHEQKKLDKLLFKILYKISNELIVHNFNTKEQLIRTFNINSNKIHVIPHGIYSNQVQKVDIQNQTEIKEKRNLLFFGIIRQYKGLDVLLKALTLLPEYHKNNIKLKIVGKNYTGINYNEFVLNYGLESIVTIIDDYIPEEEVSEYFNWADAVILPYKNISGSGALLLSYTFNKIVIASDLPSFVEETENGKTGYLFKTEDYVDLSKKIIKFIESSTKETEYFLSNIKYLKENVYNWERSAELTFKVYSND